MKTRISCHHIWADKLRYAGGSRGKQLPEQNRSHLKSTLQEAYYDRTCQNSQQEKDCSTMAPPVITPSLSPNSRTINSSTGVFNRHHPHDHHHHHPHHTDHNHQHKAYHYHHYTWCLLFAVFVAAITLQAPSAVTAIGQPHSNGTGKLYISFYFNLNKN